MADMSLTRRFSELTHEDLDVDEGKARAAADVLGGVLGEFNGWHIELEEVASALESSGRAVEARRHLSTALTTCEAVVCSLSDARDALDARWTRQAALRSSPHPA